MALYSCHNRSKVTPLRLLSWCTMAQSGVGRLAMGVWVAVANSRPSRAVSSRVSGRGQDRPAACARRTYSATVGRLTRKLCAILRSQSWVNELGGKGSPSSRAQTNVMPISRMKPADDHGMPQVGRVEPYDGRRHFAQGDP